MINHQPSTINDQHSSSADMPLIKGRGKAVLGENIKEFHTGQTYARTKAKFGKVTADKQAIAAAYAEQRRSGKAKAKKRGKS